MNPSLPGKSAGRLLYWRAWLVIFAAAVLLLSVIYLKNRNTLRGVAVDIHLNTNGTATVLGVPLGNGPIRDITLRTLNQAKVPVRVIVPSGGSAAPGWDTNSIQTINAIMKAGLIPTNKASGPSPYE